MPASIPVMLMWLFWKSTLSSICCSNSWYHFDFVVSDVVHLHPGVSKGLKAFARSLKAPSLRYSHDLITGENCRSGTALAFDDADPDGKRCFHKTVVEKTLAGRSARQPLQPLPISITPVTMCRWRRRAVPNLAGNMVLPWERHLQVSRQASE